MNYLKVLEHNPKRNKPLWIETHFKSDKLTINVRKGRSLGISCKDKLWSN